MWHAGAGGTVGLIYVDPVDGTTQVDWGRSCVGALAAVFYGAGSLGAVVFFHASDGVIKDENTARTSPGRPTRQDQLGYRTLSTILGCETHTSFKSCSVSA